MAFNFGSGDGDDEPVMADINVTPLVDVMLVLLIIFLITIPAIIQQVPLVLPPERNIPNQTKPENIVISVDQKGGIYWNDLKIANTAALIDRLKKISVLVPQPEVQIRGDGGANYLWGRGGDDVLAGGLGNDALYGEAGADTLSGGKDGDGDGKKGKKEGEMSTEAIAMAYLMRGVHF